MLVIVTHYQIKEVTGHLNDVIVTVLRTPGTQKKRLMRIEISTNNEAAREMLSTLKIYSLRQLSVWCKGSLKSSWRNTLLLIAHTSTSILHLCCVNTVHVGERQKEQKTVYSRLF